MSVVTLFARLFGRRSAGRSRSFQRVRSYERTEPELQRAPRVAWPEVVPVAGTALRRRPDGNVAAFTPTRPKSGRRQIVGRESELQRILEALREERAHVVLYSERGRGKTSLSNLTIEALRRDDVIVARYTCESGSSFESIIRGLARDLPSALMTGAAEGGDGEGCEPALPTGQLRPRDVLALLPRLACQSLICVIDEFDRVEDAATRLLLADTIKQVSDRGIGLSFMIVGVADDLERLFGQHPSIQRNIVAIHLPLLSDEDIARMLAKGGRDAGIGFAPAVVLTVTLIARGMPYMAQVLGLRIVQANIARGDAVAAEGDAQAAIARLLADTRSNVKALYEVLTGSGRNAAMVAALRQIATAEQDELARIRLVVEPGGVIFGGRRIPATLWGPLREALPLNASGGMPELVTFGDRGLAYYVLLLAARDGAAPFGREKDQVAVPFSPAVCDLSAVSANTGASVRRYRPSMPGSG